MVVSFIQKSPSTLREGIDLFKDAVREKDHVKRAELYGKAADLAYTSLKYGHLSATRGFRASQLRINSIDKAVDNLIIGDKFDVAREVLSKAVAVSMELSEYDNAIHFINKSKRLDEIVHIIELGGSARL